MSTFPYVYGIKQFLYLYNIYIHNLHIFTLLLQHKLEQTYITQSALYQIIYTIQSTSCMSQYNLQLHYG